MKWTVLVFYAAASAGLKKAKDFPIHFIAGWTRFACGRLRNVRCRDDSQSHRTLFIISRKCRIAPLLSNL